MHLKLSRKNYGHFIWASMSYKISSLTHLTLVPHICVNESGQHWFRLWLCTYSVTSHYLNQCWVIANWTLGDKLQWNFNPNTKCFIPENASGNIVCEMVTILSRGRWIKVALVLVLIKVMLFNIAASLATLFIDRELLQTLASWQLLSSYLMMDTWVWTCADKNIFQIYMYMYKNAQIYSEAVYTLYPWNLWCAEFSEKI